MELPEILKNSIEVNQLKGRGNNDVPFSRVLIGVVNMQDANGTWSVYAVRSVVEERINQDPILAEFNVLGKLYSAKVKK